MYKNFEGNELFCQKCNHTWDVDNLNYKQVCPSCGLISEGLSSMGIIRNNPFITCKCGTRVYLDCKENECTGCQAKYNQDGEYLLSKIIIARPINGISLNGNEYLLGNNGKVLKFESVQIAKDFLTENNISTDELSNFYFVEASDDE